MLDVLSFQQPIHIISGKQERIYAIANLLGLLEILGKILNGSSFCLYSEHSYAEVLESGHCLSQIIASLADLS